MKKILKDIAIQEYFADNFFDIISDIQMEEDDKWTKREFWNKVAENFQLGDSFKIISDSEDQESGKNELENLYLKYLQSYNSYTIMQCFKIMENLIFNDGPENIITLFREYEDLTKCFDAMSPNFPAVNSLLELYVNYKYDIDKVKSVLKQDSDFLSKKIKDGVNLMQIYKLDYESMFKTDWQIRILKTMKESVQTAEDRQSEYQDEEEKSLNKEAKELTEKYSFLLNGEKSKEILLLDNQKLSAEKCIEKNFGNMVGLVQQKERVLGILKMIQKNPIKPISLNFVITGNPGVGKTTFVRCLGKTFFDMGIIKSDKFIEMNGAAIKGEYVGHTIPKVKKLFSEGKNGSIFLDEAYTLFQERGDSFSSEALAEVMTQVENIYTAQEKNPEDRTFIALAGYKKQMNEFVRHNPGAARRFSINIDLEDYSDAELFEIFKMSVDEYGYELTGTDLRTVFDSFVDEKRKQDNFSNAGLVRNMFQGVLELQARRTSLEDKTITAEDVKAFIQQEKENDKGKYTKIGFGTNLEV